MCYNMYIYALVVEEKELEEKAEARRLVWRQAMSEDSLDWVVARGT